ncbi:ubiquitin-conjugating enzyme/RWD-like protein [Mycena pura]|uniref:Ubiquitin-conjugating enzyme/RWD-like protein n=1 Tax=Mycena pura TaxID=153505 RepID=A0AAD6UZJ0_9AGAR|nr:ubiquitin-conjugating enzyme/RWD-like protein [Mycena pura]
MTARLRRINKEITSCQEDKAANISIDLVNSSLFHLKGSFFGPEGTPYSGDLFEVDIMVPDDYPRVPFKIKFITKVYHPNVSSVSGAISCLSILEEEGWSPVLTLKTTLITLQSVLSSPEPNGAQDPEVAKHYTTNGRSFEETAADWTRMYAMPREGAVSAAPASGGGDARDEVSTAGLEGAHVDRFKALIFRGPRVVNRRLNYRGASVAQIYDARVMDE